MTVKLKYEDSVIEGLFGTHSKIIKSYQTHDINRLAQLRNPKLGSRNSYYATHKNLYIREEVTVTLYINSGGFTGSLHKDVTVNKSLYKKEINKINRLALRNVELSIEINQLEYDKLILPFDKSVKANFLKKIIKSKDVVALLK